MQLDRSPERATPLPSPDMTPPAAPRPSLQLPPLETKDGRGAPAVWRLFFFSRRRRHTILVGDWSSDVCSSDLGRAGMRRGTPSARCLSWTLLLYGVVVSTLPAQSEGTVLAGLPGSTRSVGMGGAGAALVGDAGAIFANPAGIATVHRLAFEASVERYLAGTSLSTAALAVRVGRLDWGVGAQALDYGTEPEIVPDPATGNRRGIPTGGFFSSADLLAVTSVVYR